VARAGEREEKERIASKRISIASFIGSHRWVLVGPNV
jgi:hypothetical protein